MPYLPTAQSFLEQSRLLISARPTTTRISTKYTLPNPSPSPRKYKYSKAKPPPSSPPTATLPPDSQQQQPSTKATLTLKTYDPVSGTCLKYQTDKAAEVGRLVAALGNCGRVMAALPDKEEGGMEVDEVKEVVVEGKGQELQGKGKATQKEAKGGQGVGKGGEKGGGGGGGGGGKKKGKGKR